MLVGLTLAAAPAVGQQPVAPAAPASAADPIRAMEAEAEATGKAAWGHWGDQPGRFISWSNHSNRLIPVYAFGTRLDDLQTVYTTGNPSGAALGSVSDTGHAIFYVRRGTAAVSGVSVLSANGAGYVLFDSGSAYQATPAHSQGLGIAILFDIPASAFPGAQKTFTFDPGGGAAAVVATIPLATGCVTRAYVDIP